MSEHPPESLLPYLEWTEDALRQVVVRAIAHVAANGLPGQHHFFLSFRTDYPGVVIPPRLRAQYPEEMTIVLQHQFWDLAVDAEAALITVGLSFSGVPSPLAIPLAAVTGFADPYAQLQLRFAVVPPPLPKPEPEAASAEANPSGEKPQVVSLDAFRRKTTPKS